MRQPTRAQLLSLLLCLATALATLGSCAQAAPVAQVQATPTAVPPTIAPSTPATVDLNAEPSTDELAAAQKELSTFQVSATSMLGKDLDQLTSQAKVIVVGKVSEVGPIFNGCRSGDSPMSPPATDEYCLSQLYTASVERTLKGTTSSYISVVQNEGYLPAAMTPTAARVKVAKGKSENSPIQVGSRYVFFLEAESVVPELSDLKFYPPLGYRPNRFLLSTDGNAALDGVKSATAEQRFPKGPEKAFLDKIERLVADKK